MNRLSPNAVRAALTLVGWIVLTIVIDGQRLDGIGMLVAAGLAAGAVAAIWVTIPLLKWLGPRRHLGRWGFVVAGLLSVLVIANQGEGDDYILAETLMMVAGATAVLLVLTRLTILDTLTRGVFWVGLGYLCLSGTVLLFLLPSAFSFDTKALHSLVGYGWTAFFFAYVVNHAMRYDSKSQDQIRSYGYLSALLLTIAVLVGVAHLLLGADTWSTATVLHSVPGGLGLLAFVMHLKRPRGEPRQLTVTSRYILRLTVLLSLALTIWPAVSGPAPDVEGGEMNHEALENPMTGLTAASSNGTGIPAELLSVRTYGGSCGDGSACHQTIHAQWERSAHRFSANPLYAEVVQRLVAEEGIAAARLCAGCHDPVALLGGQLADGAQYRPEDSEGITCAVCHGLTPEQPLGGGRFRVAAQPLDRLSRRYPLVGYMMVRDAVEDHKRAWTPDGISEPSFCGACHNLSLNGLRLRTTFDDWAKAPRESCNDCHMPEVEIGDIGGDRVADHSLFGGDVLIPPLYGGDVAPVADFIGRSLRMTITDHGAEVAITLANVGSGHPFPAAPRDLIRYWFQVRRGTGAWSDAGPESLFPLTLYDSAGAPIEHHRIWAAHRQEGPDGLDVGQSRTWRVPAPAGEGPLWVRLMHERGGSDPVVIPVP